MSDFLPLEMCCEILLRLPAESLFRFRTVCKQWRTVIDDPSFARAHTFDHQLSTTSHTLVIKFKALDSPSGDYLRTFNLDAINLFDDDQEISGSSLYITNKESSYRWTLPVSACNGLILTCHPLQIWNLSTQERLELPQVKIASKGPQLIGLGYDHAGQDFKAVVMYSQQTHIYSLRSDTWRTIGGCLGSEYEYLKEYPYQDGVFLCGALHWLLFDDNKVIALDLATEKLRHIQLSALKKTVDKNKKHVDVLGGCLAVSGYCGSYFGVWVMKNYGSDDESWIKLFSTRTDILLRPVAYMKDKNQVFLQDGGSAFFDEGWPGFFVYDVESGSLKRVRIRGLTEEMYAQIIPRSIFRLRDHCGGNGRSRIKPLRQQRKMEVSSTNLSHPCIKLRHIFYILACVLLLCTLAPYM